MKNLIILLAAILLAASLPAQRFFSKSARITFDATSASSPEKIEGTSRTATCVFDLQSGAVQFAVLMKGFEFERALMEEHFNENYVESNRFPKAEFRGSIQQPETISLAKDGTYTVKIKGILTLHGKSKEVETEGKLTVAGGKLTAASADFSVALADFDVSIPGLVADKVAKQAKIKVNCNLEPLK